MCFLTWAKSQLLKYKTQLAVLTAVGLFLGLILNLVQILALFSPPPNKLIEQKINNLTKSIENNSEQIEMCSDIYFRNKNLTMSIDEKTRQLLACQNKLPKERFCPLLHEFVKVKFGEVRVVSDCDPALGGSLSDIYHELTIDVMVIPLESQKNTRYLVDLGKSLESDRVSIFLENGLLKFQVKPDDSYDITIKTQTPTTSFYMVPNKEYGISTVVSQSNVALFVFDYSTSSLVFEKEIPIATPLDLDSAQLVVGASLDRKNTFDGAFDELRISNVVRSRDWILATHLQTSKIGG